MGRPRKPESEKLVPVSTNLPPAMYAALKRAADARSIGLSDVVRVVLTSKLRTLNTKIQGPSTTL